MSGSRERRIWGFGGRQLVSCYQKVFLESNDACGHSNVRSMRAQTAPELNRSRSWQHSLPCTTSFQEYRKVMVFTSRVIHENVASLRALELTLTCNPQKHFGHLGATDSLLDTTAAVIDTMLHAVP